LTVHSQLVRNIAPPDGGTYTLRNTHAIPSHVQWNYP